MPSGVTKKNPDILNITAYFSNPPEVILSIQDKLTCLKSVPVYISPLWPDEHKGTLEPEKLRDLKEQIEMMFEKLCTFAKERKKKVEKHPFFESFLNCHQNCLSAIAHS